MRAASDQRTPDSAGAPSPRSSSNSVKAIILRRQASLVLSAALAIAGALAGLIPYVVVYFVANELFLSGQVDRNRLLSLGLWAGAAVIAKILCKAFANAVSHTAAYRIRADLRLALAERLSRMPLGRVQVRSSGHLRKVLQDDVEQLELGLSHAIPDIAAAIAVPPRQSDRDVRDQLAGRIGGSRRSLALSRARGLGGRSFSWRRRERVGDQGAPQYGGHLVPARHEGDPWFPTGQNQLRSHRRRYRSERAD